MEPTNADYNNKPIQVRWEEAQSDKDYFGDDWPDDEACEHQMNLPEVDRTLFEFLLEEADADEDGKIDIEEFLAAVGESDGPVAKTFASAATATNATYVAPTYTTTVGGANYTIDAQLTPSVNNAKDTQSSEAPADFSGSVLTPMDISHDGLGVMEASGRFRKRVLPFADVHYSGRVLKFTKDLASKIRDNFKKRPFEQVVFNYVDEHNRHNDDPMRVLGQVRDLEVEDDGLYAEIETNDKGTEYLTNQNPDIGVSVRFFPDYKRAWDKQHFGPCIQHVAATPDPHITELGPWESVPEMSSEKLLPVRGPVVVGQSVDLSRESYVIERETEKGEEVSEENTTPNEEVQDNVQDNETKGEEAVVEASAEAVEDQGAAGESPEKAQDSEEGRGAEDMGEQSTQVEATNQAQVNTNEKSAEDILELSNKLEAAERALRAVRSRERRQAIRHKLEREYPGIAPFALSAAEEILLSADESDGEAFELSNTGEAALKDGTIAEPVKKLLDACVARVDMSGERGTTQVSDTQKDAQRQAQEKHDAEYQMYLQKAGYPVNARGKETALAQDA